MILYVGKNSELTFNKVPGGCWGVLRRHRKETERIRRSNCISLALIKKGDLFRTVTVKSYGLLRG